MLRAPAIRSFLLVTALLGLVACGKQADERVSKSGSSARAQGPTLALEAQSVPDELARLVPADTMMLLYIPSLARAEAGVQAIAKAIDPAAEPPNVAGDMLGDLGVPLDLVDPERPIAFAMSTPSPGEMPSPTVVLPIVDAGRVRKEFAPKNPASNLTVFESYAVISTKADYKPAARPARVMTSIPKGDFVLRLDLATVLAKFRPFLELAMMQQQRAAPPPNEAFSEGYRAGQELGMKWVRSWMDSAESMDLSATVSGTDIDLDVAFTVKEGSPMHGSPVKAASGLSALARLLPASNDPVVCLVRIDRESIEDFMDPLLASISTLASENEKEFAAEFSGRLHEVVKTMGTHVAASMGFSEKSPEMTLVLQPDDPAAFAKLLEEMLRSAIEHGESAELVSTSEVKVDDVTVHRLDMRITDKSPRAVPVSGGKSKERVTELYVAPAVVGERIVLVVGQSDERIEAAVRAAKGEGKLPEAAAKAFGDMDGNASFAAYVELRGLLKGLARLGGVDTVDLLQGAPISCWAQRKSDGRTRIVSIHLDAAGLAEIATR
ncbi:MAG: hypothetical protein ACE10D_02355 [Planctomycetota bacterium]